MLQGLDAVIDVADLGLAQEFLFLDGQQTASQTINTIHHLQFRSRLPGDPFFQSIQSIRESVGHALVISNPYCGRHQEALLILRHPGGGAQQDGGYPFIECIQPFMMMIDLTFREHDQRVSPVLQNLHRRLDRRHVRPLPIDREGAETLQ